MVMFNSYVKLPEGIQRSIWQFLLSMMQFQGFDVETPGNPEFSLDIC
jgi:hypothetical protein